MNPLDRPLWTSFTYDTSSSSKYDFSGEIPKKSIHKDPIEPPEYYCEQHPEYKDVEFKLYQDDVIGPKCFQFMKNSGAIGSTTLPYVKALARCQEQGATMASVHSPQQNSYFMSHIERNHWVGMQKIKNGQTPTVWEDGSKVDFTNWGVDEPHNPAYNETTGDCLRFNWDEAGRFEPGYWYTKSCDLNYKPICQKEPIRGHDPQPTVSFFLCIPYTVYVIGLLRSAIKRKITKRHL